MGLPNTKTAPTANPNSAKQAPAAASKGKSRLPAAPQGGLKAPKSYQYIDLPQGKDRGFYLLRLDVAEEITSTKDNTNKLKLEFTVLDTDTGVRVGSQVSMLPALQGPSAVYFWKEISSPFITLAGGEISDESLAEFMADGEATYEAVLSGALNGAIARCNLRRALVDKLGNDKKPTGEKVLRVYRDWEAANDEEQKKHAAPAAQE